MYVLALLGVMEDCLPINIDSVTFYGLAFYIMLLIPTYMHMYTVMLRSIVHYTSSALLNIISKLPDILYNNCSQDDFV